MSGAESDGKSPKTDDANGASEEQTGQPGQASGESARSAEQAGRQGQTNGESTEPADRTEPAEASEAGKSADTVSAPEPSAEEPATEEPGAAEPSAEKPVAEEPGAAEPSAEEPVAEEPATEEPGAEEPGTAEPGAEADSTAQQSRAATNGSGITVRFAGSTSVGLVREHNEDNFVNANLTTETLHPRDETCSDTVGERGSIFAVCDGMGGAAAGEVASQMGVDILYDALRRGELPTDRDDLARRLVSAVEEAGKRIYETAQADSSRRGMGTTVTAAVLMDKVVFFAQVGDSRAYLLRRGDLKQLTKDQSLVTQLIEAGHLTEAEAESFEHSNIILQALGTAETVQVDLTFTELRKGDRLMLCSDGLSGMVDNESIRQALTELEDPYACCARLVEQANTEGGHDNITVIVADFDGEVLADPEPTDSFGYVQYPLPPEDEAELLTEPTVPPATLPEGEEQDTVDIQVRREPEKKSSSHLWAIIGIVALVAAAVAVGLSGTGTEPEQSIGSDAHEVQPAKQPPVAESEQDELEEQAAKEPEQQPVQVRVRSDVENATLLINGEQKGPLSAAEERIIELLPGTYRFEARSNGSTAAVKVATVHPDTPLDVSLTLPSGAADPVAGRQKQEEGPGGEAKEEATEEQPAREGAATGGAAAVAQPTARPGKAPVRKSVRRAVAKRKPAKPKPVEPKAPPASVEAKPPAATKPPQEPAPAKPAKPPPPEEIPDNPF